MPLMSSERLLPGDIEHWQRMERRDARWARTAAFRRRVEDAERALDRFDRADYCGFSGGKDSVVVSHLCAGRCPIAWVEAVGIENPDNARVWGEFGRLHPSARMMRLTTGHVRYPDGSHDGGQAEFERITREIGERYVSGVRAEESATRALRVARWGHSTARTCAPLAHWTAEDVFAALYAWDLPVHPAYAMTMGGRLERGRIRVATIGGAGGSGTGRREWEQTYYADELAEIRRS